MSIKCYLGFCIKSTKTGSCLAQHDIADIKVYRQDIAKKKKHTHNSQIALAF